ncbi:serpin family protein [Pyrococcus kukulkanii]|uniref:serpin family protein n=1 Tax=Pyrococcus kukulkanii TaxID=1609559 RepID=UPI003561EB94
MGEGYENVVEANNNFAVNLYKSIGGKDNLVISPLSVFLAFSMLYEGSEGVCPSWGFREISE